MIKIEARLTNQSPPKYVQIMDDLTGKINRGELLPGDQIPTENELMKEFKVSRIVIVNSLTRLAADGVIIRIPGKGSFVSESPAPPKETPAPVFSMVKPRSPQISFIIPGIESRHAIGIAHGIAWRIHQRGMTCSITFSGNDIQIEEQLIDFASTQNPAGLFIFPSNQEVYNKKLINLADSGFPIVLLDRDLPGLGLSSVQTDNSAATEMATSYLIGLGHKKIGICSQTPMPTTSVSNRIDGFISEMKKHNLMIDPTHLFTKLGSDDSLEQLVEIVKTKSATALVCLTMFDYLLVSRVLKENGLSCPEDVSMVSIDDPEIYDFYDKYTTCIVQDADKIAHEAVSLLFDMIENKTVYEKKVLVTPTFVEGCSTKRVSE